MHVLIVGWYGTETVGDKAILAGIISEYQEKHADISFTIASIFPFITVRTVKELEINARIIPTYSFEFFRLCANADHIVMGGGPLMDTSALAIPLWAFITARLFRKKRIIYGCGLGPLKVPRYLKAVTRILRLANEVQLRDSNSIAFAKTLVDRDDYKLTRDPSQIYLTKIQPKFSIEPKNEIALFIRDWPYEYASHLSETEFEAAKVLAEQNLATFLIDTAKSLGENCEIVLYPMHCFSVGNDDRVYARYFVSKYLNEVNSRAEMHPSSVNSIVKAMLDARLCICMRFHSVVFAHTLNCKFIALDYTSGGKIYGFMKDNSALDRYILLEDIAKQPNNLANQLSEVIAR